MPASLMIWLMDASLKGRWENSRVAASNNFSCFSAGRFKKVLLGTLFHPLLYEIEGPFSSAPPKFYTLPLLEGQGISGERQKKYDNLSLIIADKLSYCKRELLKFTNISHSFCHFVQRPDSLIGLGPVGHRADPAAGDAVLGGVAE